MRCMLFSLSMYKLHRQLSNLRKHLCRLCYRFLLHRWIYNLYCLHISVLHMLRYSNHMSQLHRKLLAQWKCLFFMSDWNLLSSRHNFFDMRFLYFSLLHLYWNCYKLFELCYELFIQLQYLYSLRFWILLDEWEYRIMYSLCFTLQYLY